MSVESTANQAISSAKTWFDVALAFLDWPVLLFVILLIFIWHFKPGVAGLLERGDIQIGWGENKFIKLKDISDEFDQEIDPLREEVQALREELKKLAKNGHESGAKSVKIAPRELDEQQTKAANTKIIEGLQNHKYRWRSVERLAAISGTSEKDALEILRANPEVVLGIGKSKSRIARLKDR